MCSQLKDLFSQKYSAHEELSFYIEYERRI